jgi:hypothetical protein
LKEFVDCINYAISRAVSDILGHHIFQCVFGSDEPEWVRRIKAGHVLPWMLTKRHREQVTHAPVLMHRSIVSLRVQTHTVK